MVSGGVGFEFGGGGDMSSVNFLGTPLRLAYPRAYSSSYEYRDYRVDCFFSSIRLSEPLSLGLRALGNAEAAVIGAKGELLGQATIVGRRLAISPAHCVEGNTAKLCFADGRSFMGKCVVDGTQAPEGFQSDFKIFLLPESAVDIQPVKLSVSNPSGDSLKVFFVRNNDQYIRPVRSEGLSSLASRSHRALEQTVVTESGTPSLNVTTAAVHSFHQGEAESLTVNQIHQTLQQMKRKGDCNASGVLGRMSIIDRGSAGLNWSSVSLEMDSVRPEGGNDVERAEKRRDQHQRRRLERQTNRYGPGASRVQPAEKGSSLTRKFGMDHTVVPGVKNKMASKIIATSRMAPNPIGQQKPVPQSSVMEGESKHSFESEIKSRREELLAGGENAKFQSQVKYNFRQSDNTRVNSKFEFAIKIVKGEPLVHHFGGFIP